MNDGTIRVVLLAREGPVRERLLEALQAAGVAPVATFDPADAGEAQVLDASPQAILVALEPAVEDALDRLDGVLSDPALNVLFEEAELVVQREGWEAARWRRHLSAKLHRHDDVLPPGSEQEEDWTLSPGPLPARAEIADLDGTIAALADEAGQHLDEVAGDRTFEGLDGDAAAPASSPFDPVAFETDGGLVEVDAADLAAFEFEGLSFVPESASSESASSDSASEVAGASADEASPLTFAGITLALESEAAEGAAPDAGDAAPRDPGPGRATDDGAEPAPQAPAAGGLSLVEDDAPAAPAASARPAADLEALEDRIAGLSLAEPDSYGFGRLHGAVLVEAGVGGPDAVRQLLSAIPAGFPRAILVRMQLDGQRNRRLAKQMERVTSLVVEVACKQEPVVAGRVYFLPPDIGLSADRARLVFVEQPDASTVLPDALPAADSAVLLLSGANRGLADALAAPAWSAALVGGQSADESYDPAAATALAERGATVGTAAALARMLVERWPPANQPPPPADEELQP